MPINIIERVLRNGRQHQLRNPTGLHVLWLNGMATMFSLCKVGEYIFGFRDKMIINREEQLM